MKNAIAFVLVCTIFYGITHTALLAMDKTMINGWCIVETHDNHATIELDENLSKGSDANCRRVARIITSLGKSGYEFVRVLNWHDERILTPKWAERAMADDAKY